jgi:hypothetical protein
MTIHKEEHIFISSYLNIRIYEQSLISDFIDWLSIVDFLRRKKCVCFTPLYKISRSRYLHTTSKHLPPFPEISMRSSRTFDISLDNIISVFFVSIIKKRNWERIFAYCDLFSKYFINSYCFQIDLHTKFFLVKSTKYDYRRIEQ